MFVSMRVQELGPQRVTAKAFQRVPVGANSGGLGPRQLDDASDGLDGVRLGSRVAATVREEWRAVRHELDPIQPAPQGVNDAQRFGLSGA